MITAKIEFGILLCCLPMWFLIFSLVFLMFPMMFAKTSLLFFSVFDYSKPRCYYSCPYAVMRSLNAIIRVVCCYAKPRCYYSCPYAVMQNLDAIICVRMLLCETLIYYLCPYSQPITLSELTLSMCRVTGSLCVNREMPGY